MWHGSLTPSNERIGTATILANQVLLTSLYTCNEWTPLGDKAFGGCRARQSYLQHINDIFSVFFYCDSMALMHTSSNHDDDCGGAKKGRGKEKEGMEGRSGGGLT